MDKVMGPLLLAASAAALLLAGCQGTGHDESLAKPRSHSLSAMPADAQGERIRFGRAIFDDTPRLAPACTGGKNSCGDCHIKSGTETTLTRFLSSCQTNSALCCRYLPRGIPLIPRHHVKSGGIDTRYRQRITDISLSE